VFGPSSTVESAKGALRHQEAGAAVRKRGYRATESILLFGHPEITIYTQRCSGDPSDGRRNIINGSLHEVCLVRTGCFHYRSSCADVLADNVTSLVSTPFEEADVYHPVPGGDTDTSILLSDQVVAGIAGGLPDVVPGPRLTTPRIDLWHRELIAAAQDPDRAPAVEEMAVHLSASVLAQAEPARVAHGQPATAQARRDLVHDARAALAQDTGLDQIALARLLGCSPYHLSRVFRQHVGMTLTRYRLRLRLNRALELLMDSDDNLAVIAAACGFADHAHLTRTIRRELDTTPSALDPRLHASMPEAGASEAQVR
jgi:AraC-like DNA-binding protein